MSPHAEGKYQLLFEEANCNLGKYLLQDRKSPGALIMRLIGQTHLDFSGLHRLPLDECHAPAQQEHREPLQPTQRAVQHQHRAQGRARDL